MPDFIPTADNAFDRMFTLLAGYIGTGGGAALGLPDALVSAFAANADTFATALRAAEAAATAAQAATAEKDAARALCVSLARQANAFAQANPAVTAVQRESAGLPVRKPRRTAVRVPDTHPVLVRVDQSYLVHLLWFADQHRPGSYAKPAGVTFCEVRVAVVAPGGAVPADPAALPLAGHASSAPFHQSFHAADVGGTAYYALRWINSTGQPGPWGIITGKLVT